MRFRPGLATWFVSGCIVATSSFAAEKSGTSDSYANDPYWYRPGHPITPADSAAIKTAPGFKAERVLTVPREMGSWTALCVDSQGRLLAAAQQQPGLFRITLPALDRDDEQAQVEKLGGVAAKLGWSHGLLYAFGSLYVTVSEQNDSLDRGVYRLADTDGDDQFDQSSLLFKLDGVGEHGPHNLVVSPDRKSLLIMCGNRTKVPEEVTSRRTVAASGVDHLMPPGFESSHAAVQGWVMRFDPDGGNREVVLSGLRNSFDLAFDQNGELFTFDSDAEWDLGTPWYRPTRICHLVPGGEYGWRDDAAVWPEYFEDSVAPVLNIGPGSPSGLTFGYGAKFPAKFQRALFVCDWTFATVHAIFLEPHGATYRAQVTEFVGGAGLPLTDAVVGQDGAMYLVVGGRRLGSALYRIRYVGEESVEPAGPSTISDAVSRRRELERVTAADAASAIVDEVWPDLGDTDRALRFASRVALEKQPAAQWRDRALHENNVDRKLTALLALARQGTEADQIDVARACSSLAWGNFTAEQKLRGLRIYELSLARGGESVAKDRSVWQPVLNAPFPNTDARVTRELSRLRCALGDATVIDPVLALMKSDTGQRQALGTSYFDRNPKYGQAVREMLEAAPLVERMHHAQMLLWLTDQWTPEQRRTYFELLADAVAYSKGGHQYAEFWQRIRDAALERMPAGERDALAKLGAPSAFTPATESVPPPQGPGREWTIDSAMELASAKLSARDFGHGKRMYSSAGCIACHRLGGEGGTIGPDLSGLGQRFTVSDIIEAIIEPSRVISDQYRMMLLQIKDGRSYSGRILSHDAESTRIAPNLMRPGQTLAVPNHEIVSEQALPVSIMPSGLVNPLNSDELLDLLAYLISGADPTHAVFRTPPSDQREP